MTDTRQSPFDYDTRAVSTADTLTPADRYQELFVAVQTQRVFPDSKTFVDCAPRQHPERILEAYRAQCGEPDFNLKAFVMEHFELYRMEPTEFVANPDDSLAEHIDRLWPVLTRHPRQHPEFSSLLPLPHDYVVPGGRFTELYYWDSYFTMLGLDESGHCELLRSMADNFAYLIDTYGHVPNGNRSYYLSRSQPPVFALMTDLFEETGVHRASDYLPQLRKEHAFWTAGGELLRPGEAHRRCVCLADGSVLNRYWDERDTPREESYLEDVETARASGRPAHEVYRDLRAGAESGWDFSSRWLGEPERLSSIRTTHIVPVDLNSFLYKLERQIARLSDVKGWKACAEEFRQRADARLAAIATCGTSASALISITTGSCNRRVTTSPRRPLRRCSCISPARSRRGGSPRSSVSDCWRRVGCRPPKSAEAASSGTAPTDGRRCSGWASAGSSTTATMRWRCRSRSVG